MDEEDRRRAIAVYDHFTHVSHDRRAAMAALTRLAGSAAAAELLFQSIAASPAAAAQIAETDPRLAARTLRWPVGPGRSLEGYWAAPRDRPQGVVVVLHENRGLQPYTRDVARRLAVAGFAALAPDLLSPEGGTPADEDRAREAIAALDLGRTLADVRATLGWIAAGGAPARGRIGVLGFCWGGALADRVATSGDPHAAAICAFYGPAPAPETAAAVRAPLLLHYAGLDTRVEASARPWLAALAAAGRPVESYVYPGVDHAFHNDTSAARYNAPAATLAWTRTLAFFHRTLG
ncbi:dienelactone hydrolase family protein [Sphingomonas morindae]|uniref:Dienelactone hydrolase family protein n=1 Tax=Sphingomonas morindae TaxID=1541170 RepID=A0ABY4X3M2_9SPHN|nr:dienelactone hydrolase family protein [Sphingomonas morindae]USI71484.1 dienelactone hydrolase family protein [Sphingomonas morindae]